MGTTTTFDLPYPEPTDRARNGSVAVRALADRLEAVLQPSFAIAPAGPTQAGVSGPTACTFGAIESTSGEWTRSSDTTLTYTGPTRWFLVDFEVDAAAPGAVSTDVSAVLWVNSGANPVGQAKSTLQIGGGGTGALMTMLRITVPTLLTNGSVIGATIDGDEVGAIFASKRVQIASIGPAL